MHICHHRTTLHTVGELKELTSLCEVKKLLVLQEGGSIPVPPTLFVIRVVLLHTERFVESFNNPTVCERPKCQVNVTAFRF